MARERWTLALIIICLPILATVITAFRVRDLPRNEDINKLDVKKVKPCENCDVKAGSKVHSVKIESDKRKLDELKKAVRDKQQQINLKNVESKPVHKIDVKSEEDDDDNDNLDFLKVKTGFIREPPKITSSPSEIKSESSSKKVNNKNDDDDDDDDDGDDEESKEKSKPLRKVTILEKPKPVLKSTPVNKVTIVNKIEKKVESHERNDSDDDDVDDYDGLDNVEELFKISGIKKKPKKPAPIVKDTKNKNEEKPVKLKQLDKSSENKDDDDDDDNEGDDDDKSEEKQIYLKSAKSSKQKEEKPSKLKQSEVSKKKQDANDDDDDNHDDDDDDDDDDSDEKQKSPRLDNKNINPAIKKTIDDKKQPIQDTKLSETKHGKEQQKQENIKTAKSIETKPVENEPVVEKKTQDTKPKVETKVAKSHETKENAIPVKEKIIEEVKRSEKPEGKKQDAKPKDDKVDKSKEPLEGKKPKVEEKDSKKDKEPPKPKEPEQVKPKLDSKEDKIDVSPKKTEKDSIKPKSDEKIDKPRPEQKSKVKDSKEDSREDDDEYATLKKIKLKRVELETQAEHKPKENNKDKKSSEKKYSSQDTKHEDYLKHVTDALQRRNLMKSEFEDFYSFFPTFAPNFSRIHNPECRRHGLIVMRQLRGTKLWALNMLDATAKIPSGILQGNGIQLGDFDQCVGTRARVQLDTGSVVKVQGKYCLARIDVKAEHPELEAPVYLAQAKSLIRSKIDDPGHFVPRFSTLSWGVCVPSVCKPEDVEVILKDAIKHYQHTSGVIIRVKVDEEDCHVDDDDPWEDWLELPTILTLSFYGVIILLVLVATIQDFLSRRQSDEAQDEGEKPEGEQENTEKDEGEKKSSDGFITSFSLYRTVDKLVAPGTDDEISCIHGVRGIATLALLVAHKFLPVAVMPYTNRVRITEIASSPIWSWCRAGWIFTDCFLLLSGTLTAHRIDSGATRRLFFRYLRLTPALLAVVLFYAYIWDKLSTGPMWGTFVTKNAEVCQQGWWWNLLYVQNYFGFEDMCAPQTHQLALDMQLTILGGIIIWAIQSEIPFIKLLLPAIHLISAYLRYTTVRDHRLTLLAYHGVSVSQLYRTARLSYMSTLHRCSPYLIGISLGLALKKPAKHGKIILTLGWLTSTFLLALVVWAGLDSGSTKYRYNSAFAAQYAAIAPIASAMATAWVIYAVHTGTCGFLSRWLCSRPLVLVSRLSYALYLTQFIVFITNIGTVKTSREFTLISLVDVQETIAIMFVSVVLTLTFVIPMQSLNKVFTFKSKPKSEPESTEEKPEQTEQKESSVEKEPVEEVKEELQMPVRRSLLAHREVLEEIPEMEVEYESQREKSEALDEILEEEEEVGEETIDDDLEIIEEEEADEEEAWTERRRERIQAGDEDRDLDEWEWTNGNGRTGAQYYRYTR